MGDIGTGRRVTHGFLLVDFEDDPLEDSLTAPLTRSADHSPSQYASGAGQADPERVKARRIRHASMLGNLSQTYEQGSSVWRFRHTFSYWVVVFFVMGSALFVLGSVFIYFPTTQTRTDAFVTLPYFIGALCYTIGSYASYLEVINLNVGKSVIYWSSRGGPGVDASSFYSTVFYTFGSILFNLMTAIPLWHRLEAWLPPNVYWIIGTSGSILFVLAGVCELVHNKAHKVKSFRRLATTLALLNFLGGASFLGGSVVGLMMSLNELLMTRVMAGFYLAGSTFYLMSSLFGQYMWKREQYGLWFVRQLNKHQPSAYIVTNIQWAALLATQWSFAGAMVHLGFLIIKHSNFQVQSLVYELFDAVILIVMVFGVLLLGSVLHHNRLHRPFLQLHNYLMAVMVMCSILLTYAITADIANVH